MTREPQATTKSQTFRASGKSLFFKNLNQNQRQKRVATLDLGQRFAQARHTSFSKQQVVRVDHRPAERSGAD